MPLRLVNKERTHEVTICDTIFHIVSMTITEKDLLVHNLGTMTVWAEKNPDKQMSDRMLDLLAGAIVKIEGHDKMSVREVIDNMEDFEQLKEVITAVIMHCSLTDDEVKNFNSLSEQSTPEPMGNVEKHVSLDAEPVSTTVNSPVENS